MKPLTWANVLEVIRAAGPRGVTHQQIAETLGGHLFYADLRTLTRLMIAAGDISVWRFTGQSDGDIHYAKGSAWVPRLFVPAPDADALGPPPQADTGSVNDALRHAVRHGAERE